MSTRDIILRRALWCILLPIDLCAALLAVALHLAQSISIIMPYLIHAWTIWMAWDISRNLLHHPTWSAVLSAAITAVAPVVSEAIIVWRVGLGTPYGVAILIAIAGYLRLYSMLLMAPMAYLHIRYTAWPRPATPEH